MEETRKLGCSFVEFDVLWGRAGKVIGRNGLFTGLTCTKLDRFIFKYRSKSYQMKIDNGR
jgi:hypothetical protein